MSARLIGLSGVLGAMVVGGLVALFVPAEDDATAGPDPQNLIIGCDPSGARPEAVCNSQLLREQGRRWQKRSADAPRARLRVFMAGGDFGSTRQVANLVARGIISQDAQTELAAQQRHVDEALAAIPILDDARAKGNRSDLLSLLVVVARASQEIPGGGTALLLATDGRLISQGFNAEKVVPTAAAVKARLDQSAIHVDLSGFGSIMLCGLHNEEIGARDLEALGDLWRDLIRLLGGPNPIILDSCTSLDDAQPGSAP